MHDSSVSHRFQLGWRGNLSDYKRRREVELKHGRVAMCPGSRIKNLFSLKEGFLTECIESVFFLA